MGSVRYFADSTRWPLDDLPHMLSGGHSSTARRTSTVTFSMNYKTRQEGTGLSQADRLGAYRPD